METGTKGRSCCFTGHRKLPQEQLEEIRICLREEVIKLINNGVYIFYSGFASGFDTISALTVNELKNKYPHIKLMLVLPYRQEINIPYDECICLSDRYKRGCFHIRNRYLVEHSDYCICYLTEDKGGTFYTVNYAYNKGLNIVNIANKRV